MPLPGPEKTWDSSGVLLLHTLPVSEDTYQSPPMSIGDSAPITLFEIK